MLSKHQMIGELRYIESSLGRRWRLVLYTLNRHCVGDAECFIPLTFLAIDYEIDNIVCRINSVWSNRMHPPILSAKWHICMYFHFNVGHLAMYSVFHGRQTKYTVRLLTKRPIIIMLTYNAFAILLQVGNRLSFEKCLFVGILHTSSRSKLAKALVRRRGRWSALGIFTTSSYAIASASICLPQSPLPTSYQHYSCLSWFWTCWPFPPSSSPIYRPLHCLQIQSKMFTFSLMQASLAPSNLYSRLMCLEIILCYDRCMQLNENEMFINFSNTEQQEKRRNIEAWWNRWQQIERFWRRFDCKAI